MLLCFPSSPAGQVATCPCSSIEEDSINVWQRDSEQSKNVCGLIFLYGRRSQVMLTPPFRGGQLTRENKGGLVRFVFLDSGDSDSAFPLSFFLLRERQEAKRDVRTRFPSTKHKSRTCLFRPVVR